jgi:hypothetical protein
MQLEDSIVLGVLFHEKEQNFKTFMYREDLAPMHALAPFVYMDIIHKLLQGIKHDVESDVHSKKEFDIQEYTRFYLNSYRFTEIETIQYENLQQTIDRITKEFFAL